VQHAFGVELPKQWMNAPVTWVPDASSTMGGAFVSTGNIVNLPAVLVVLGVTVVLVIGIKESARFNAVIVFIKTAVVLAFIAAAASFVKPENWTPFIPPNEGVFGRFGYTGILQGATMVFFAYIGFDAVSTAAQETRNPQRDLPIGILGSLAVCTVLYIAVSLILTGVVPYTQLNVPHPISVGIAATGITWMQFAVEIGAIAGLTSVMLVMLLGQPRIFFSMAMDGLFPQVATKIHPRFGTPYVTTIITGIICAVAGGMLPIDVLAELTSIGTLFAFVLVCIGVMILRRSRPDLPRAFRVPGGPYLVPILGVLTSGGLMYSATTHTIIRLFAWLAIGMIFYYFYGRRHSKLRLAAAQRSR
jgi:APA family basic amino acid/polyamine antiporter